jgi:hypothetical protein
MGKGIAVALAVFAIAVAGYGKGYYDAKQAVQVAEGKKLTAQVDANTKLQEKLDEETQAAADRERALRLDYVSAVERLRRERPARLPEPARAHCKGATGAELSAEDGIFLRGEATAAAVCWSELGRCYRYADEVGGK